MKRILSIIAALMLVLTMTTPVAAGTSHVILYTGDGWTGNACLAQNSSDADFSNGITNGIGATCGTSTYNNNVESLYLHMHYTWECYVFYTGANFTGTAYVFHDQLNGYYELPGNQDNLFSSYKKGVQGSGSTCT